jgi:uncharacterized protein YutE (UPF0331/DUF86 family)
MRGDRDLIRSRLVSLQRCLMRVQERCPIDVATLRSDLDLQDIVTLNLERAVQLAVDIAGHVVAANGLAAPGTMAAAFDGLADLGVISGKNAARMRKAVGFRNVAVHQYDALDWDVVFAIATVHLDDFRSFSAAVRNHVLTSS